MNIVFVKHSYDIETVNSQLKEYCAEKGIDDNTLLKMQLISEEFLTNILFPNFDGEVKILIFLKDKNKVLTFEYKGTDYMKNINDTTIISHKLLEKQSEEITKIRRPDLFEKYKNLEKNSKK